ncbi:MAG TPA: 2-oxoacid:acceptor oxidoreductase, partial [Clostridiales bacterium]|nr:2-oxoacid:acceptor oxidoreductase [Clostridiales bacterium]
MSKLSFRDHLCKGCGLCVAACPKHLLSLDTSRLNQKGFHPAHIEDQD